MALSRAFPGGGQGPCVDKRQEPSRLSGLEFCTEIPDGQSAHLGWKHPQVLITPLGLLGNYSRNSACSTYSTHPC